MKSQFHPIWELYSFPAGRDAGIAVKARPTDLALNLKGFVAQFAGTSHMVSA
jgi:hypothetical protein